jgi:hypothetical protein
VETLHVHVPHAHPRRRRLREEGLPRWLEFAVAVTALITSISSIVIAIESGKSMDRLVKANSLPFLSTGFSNSTPEGKPLISLDLVNAGVGPAHEKSLRVKVEGRYVRSVDELIAATLGVGAVSQFSDHVIKNAVRTRFIPGGRTQQVFSVSVDASDAEAWNRLNKATKRWTIESCYCSVFDECWALPSELAEPQPVKECRRDEPHEFVP